MHNDSPGPFTATQIVTCLGGPDDGRRIPVGIHTSEFFYESPPDSDKPPSTPRSATHYRYCPFATARFRKPCFIHQSITFDFYAQ